MTREVILSLARLDDLFAPVSLLGTRGSANLPCGVERLVVDLEAGGGGAVRAIIRVPEGDLEPGTEGRVREAVREYCDMRSSVIEGERRALRRLGFGSLRVGLPLLVIGLGLYTLLHHVGASPLVKLYVANGLLLVTAWVGLWFPLDTLIYYGRPYGQELHALERLRAAEIVLQPR